MVRSSTVQPETHPVPVPQSYPGTPRGSYPPITRVILEHVFHIDKSPPPQSPAPALTPSPREPTVPRPSSGTNAATDQLDTGLGTTSNTNPVRTSDARKARGGSARGDLSG